MAEPSSSVSGPQLEQLERDCKRYLANAAAALGQNQTEATAVPAVPLAVASVHALIDALLSYASKQEVPSAALGTLERAEQWCDALDVFVREGNRGRSPVESSGASAGRVSPIAGLLQPSSAFPLITRVRVALAKETTYGLIRDAAALAEQWPTAIRYARRAHRIGEAIYSIVHTVLQRDFRVDELRDVVASEGMCASDVEVLEFERLAGQFNPQRAAKNLMNLCVLVSKVKRHNDAAQYALDAVQILRPATESFQSHGTPHRPPTADGSDPLESGNPGALLAAALFNLGTQLEQCKRHTEALAAFDEGLDAAEQFLGRKHPVTKQLRSIIQKATAVTPASSMQRASRLPAVSGSSAGQAYFIAGDGAHAKTQRDPKPVSSLQAPSSRGRMSDDNFSATRAMSSSAAVDARRAMTAPSSQDLMNPPVWGPRPPPAGIPRPVAQSSRHPPPQTHAAATAPMDDSMIPVTAVSLRPPLSMPLTQLRPNPLRPGLTLQPLGQLPSRATPVLPHSATGSARSRSTPTKQRGWVNGEPTDEVKQRDDAPVAVLDLSEALRDEERQRFIPTVERMSAGSQRSQPPVVPLMRIGVSGDDSQPLSLVQKTSVAQLHRDDTGTKGSSRSVRSQPGSTAKLPTAPTPSDQKRRRTPSSSSKNGVAGTVLSADEQDALRDEQLARWASDVTEKQFETYCRRFRAAVTIQCAWRCCQARLERFNRQQLMYYFAYQEQRAAVACIASAFWRWKARKNLEKARQAKRHQIAARVERERREVRAASTIVKAARHFLCETRHKRELLRKLRLKQESKLVLYESASVLVQRWWRIVVVQKAYWRRRHAEIAEEKRQNAINRRLHDAATNIQRVVRGIRGRAYAISFRRQKREEQKAWQHRLAESTDCVRTFLLEVKSRLSKVAQQPKLVEQAREDAAVTIQQGWASSLQRRAVKQNCERSRSILDAVLKIQRCYRRYRARRELRVLRIISRTTGQLRIEREFRQSRAAQRIQCAFRVHLSRRWAAKAKASFGRRVFSALMLLQRVGRGGAARIAAGEDRFLRDFLTRQAVEVAVQRRFEIAAAVQRHARAYLSRQERAARQDAVDREELLIARRARREIIQDTAATKIQSVVRRQQAGWVVERERRIRAEEEKYVLRSVVRIQCLFRRAAARSELARRQLADARKRQKLMLEAQVAHEVFVMNATTLENEWITSREAVAEREAHIWKLITAVEAQERSAHCDRKPVSRKIEYFEDSDHLIDHDDEDEVAGIYDD